MKNYVLHVMSGAAGNRLLSSRITLNPFSSNWLGIFVCNHCSFSSPWQHFYCLHFSAYSTHQNSSTKTPNRHFKRDPIASDIDLAEEQGFEPWVELPPQRFSRPSRSAAPALLLGTIERNITDKKTFRQVMFYPDFKIFLSYLLIIFFLSNSFFPL